LTCRGGAWARVPQPYMHWWNINATLLPTADTCRPTNLTWLCSRPHPGANHRCPKSFTLVATTISPPPPPNATQSFAPTLQTDGFTAHTHLSPQEFKLVATGDALLHGLEQVVRHHKVDIRVPSNIPIAGFGIHGRKDGGFIDAQALATMLVAALHAPVPVHKASNLAVGIRREVGPGLVAIGILHSSSSSNMLRRSSSSC
jgi:hypothetical protein